EIDKQQQQRGVQRREQIKWRVYSTKPVKDRADRSAGMRARESKAQREKQKANASNENCGYDPPRKDSQLLVCSTKERGRDEKKVDRHVGENHERNEWDGALPLKIKRADLTAVSRDPIATAVNNQEQGRQSCRNAKRFDLLVKRHSKIKRSAYNKRVILSGAKDLTQTPSVTQALFV